MANHLRQFSDFIIFACFDSKIIKSENSLKWLLLPNEGRQWQNLLGCDNWVLSGSPEPAMVGFCDLIRVGIGPVSKKLAVKSCSEFG